ncbi:transcription factor TFIIIB subunit brf1 [Conglomerata obtusa]
MTTCTSCNTSSLHKDLTLGLLFCTTCGTVASESLSTSTPSFPPVTYTMNTFASPRLHTFAQTDRIETLLNTLCTTCALPLTFATSSLRWYKLSLQHNLSKGRSILYTLAACLYVTCRMERMPMMIVDFSGLLRISCAGIGKVYGRIKKKLFLRVKGCEAEMYIRRYVQQLGIRNRIGEECWDIENNEYNEGSYDEDSHEKSVTDELNYKTIYKNIYTTPEISNDDINYKYKNIIQCSKISYNNNDNKYNNNNVNNNDNNNINNDNNNVNNNDNNNVNNDDINNINLTSNKTNLEAIRKMDVVSLATRIVSWMKRDWIITGRRPNNVCGAAILIASRIVGDERSIEEVAKVVKGGVFTIQKRIKEINNTETANMSVEQFMRVWLEKEEDPPLVKIRKRNEEEIKRRNTEKHKIINGINNINDNNLKLDFNIDNIKIDMKCINVTTCLNINKTDNNDNNSNTIVNANIKNNKKNNDDLCSEENSLVENSEENNCDEDKENITHFNNLNKNNFFDFKGEDDDSEIQNCLLPENEIKKREIIWNDMYEDFMREKENKPIIKSKKKKINEIVKDKKSSKLNYKAIENLFDL